MLRSSRELKQLGMAPRFYWNSSWDCIRHGR